MTAPRALRRACRAREANMYSRCVADPHPSAQVPHEVRLTESAA